MKINFSQIEFNKYEQIEQPIVKLQTLGEETIGFLAYAHNLTLKLKFNEPSQISFDLPAQVDGEDTPIYERVTGRKIIQIDPYGKYVLNNVEVESDGIKTIKHCEGFSLEYTLKDKQLVLGKGTYSFYNSVSLENTIMGFVMELIPDWHIGEVDPLLYGKYRTFDNISKDLLGFMLNTLQETYGCVFIFDTYTKTVSVRSDTSTVADLQIYLSHQNLIKNATVTEVLDNFVTAINVNGADPVSIRNVNPMGINKIYNIDSFIERGDIPPIIVQKWRAWETNFKASQLSYTNISALRSSCISRHTAESARLTDMQGALISLQNVRDTVIQAIANQLKTQADLDAINVEITAQEAKITAQNALLKTIKTEETGYTKQLKAINESSSFDAFMSPLEISVIQRFFVESTFTDSTFALSETGSFANDGINTNIASATVNILNSTITKISVPASLNKRMYQLSGGKIEIKNGADVVLSAEIFNSTLEYKKNKECIWSFYMGSGTSNGTVFPSGNLTLICNANSLPSDISNNLSLAVTDMFMYFTRNVTQYQSFSVEKELFDYAQGILKDLSQTSYEFNIDSGNFIFLKDFEQFKNALQLGSNVYLKLDNGQRLKPTLLEISLDFENPCNFNMIFSNEFQRPDGVNKLGKKLKKTFDISNKVDFNKYNYNSFLDSGARSQLLRSMTSAYDASLNAILGGKNQSIKIDGGGFKSTQINDDGTISPKQLAITNTMLAFTKDNWATASLGIGEFTDKNLGSQYGVVAPNLKGTIVAGQNLIIESMSPDGLTTQFKVDGSGAYLYNSRFLTASDNGGQVALDPAFGLAIGGGLHKPLYHTDATGNLVLNKDNANLYTDLDGTLALKNIKATGEIYGSKILGSEMYIGGANTPANCKFGVDAAGNVLGIETLNSKLKFDKDGNATFGNNVNISGNLNMTGSINWSPSNFPMRSQFSETGISNTWHDTMTATDTWRRDMLFNGTWGVGYQFVGKDGKPGNDGSDANVPPYVMLKGLDFTNITGNYIKSPTIYGGKIYAGDGNNYAEMENTAFSLYQNGVAEAKASLYLYDGSDNTYAALALGSGSGSTTGDGETTGRFYIEKKTHDTDLYFVNKGGQKVGLRFDIGADGLGGTITLLGDTKLNVPAVFG